MTRRRHITTENIPGSDPIWSSVDSALLVARGGVEVVVVVAAGVIVATVLVFSLSVTGVAVATNPVVDVHRLCLPNRG